MEVILCFSVGDRAVWQRFKIVVGKAITAGSLPGISANSHPTPSI